MMIVVLGPDGSGKSTVINELRERLDGEFKEIQHCHLIPGRPITQTRTHSDVILPHDKKSYNKALSLLKLIFLMFRYYLGFLLNRTFIESNQTLMILDRYYHDILVDPMRFRYGGDIRLAKLAGSLIPQPDLYILLDTPEELIQSRKQEVSLAETKRQCAEYRTLISELPGGYRVDASGTAAQIVSDIHQQVILTMIGKKSRVSDNAGHS